ncbi:MAG TPA: PEP-CTERM sorting domain-containing protein [Bryobacteraceae bacterium]|nr:PEP-CTERM sorting domain-containing protein [Bryobacteraceae bacterium]
MLWRARKVRIWKARFWPVGLLGLAAVSCQAGNIVTNPSFTSGTTGWTFGSNFAVGTPGHSGPDSAQTGCTSHASVSDPTCEISQILTTTPGATYFLSFFVTEDDGPTSEMVIDWDGTQVADVLNPNNCVGCGGASFSPWLQFTFNNLVASTGSTNLQIFGRDDPSAIFFTDFVVDLQGAPGVPEPTSFYLLGVGLAVLCWIGGRRRSAYFSFSRSSKNRG